MTTERGRLSYVNNLKQIRNATLDTIYLGVIRAYLHCKTVGQHMLELYGSNPSQSQVRRVVAEELEMWACVQKSSNAMQIADLRMKRRMRKMGVSPDMWIFPEGEFWKTQQNTFAQTCRTFIALLIKHRDTLTTKCRRHEDVSHQCSPGTDTTLFPYPLDSIELHA